MSREPAYIKEPNTSTDIWFGYLVCPGQNLWPQWEKDCSLEMSWYYNPSSSHPTLTTRIQVPCRKLHSPHKFIIKSSESVDSELGKKGERRLSCMPIVAFRGAICSQPSLWGGNWPGGISPVNQNLCQVSISRGPTWVAAGLLVS